MKRNMKMMMLMFLVCNGLMAYQIETKDITFESEGYTLKGKLLLPEDIQKKYPL